MMPLLVSNENTILEKSKKYNVIGIDEAQFFSNLLVDTCNKLANKGKRVIVAGLDMDFRGKPFGPMPNLMATAEFVSKLHGCFVIKLEKWQIIQIESQKIKGK